MIATLSYPGVSQLSVSCQLVGYCIVNLGLDKVARGVELVGWTVAVTAVGTAVDEIIGVTVVVTDGLASLGVAVSVITVDVG